MVTLLELFLKEGLLLVLLALLGSGVVTLLKGADAGSRIALAPASGLALGSVVLTTAHFVLRMELAAFVVLIPLVVVSVAVAVRAARRSTIRPTRRDIAQIAAAILVVAALLSWPLADRGSFGPIGYKVFDANSYVAFNEAARHHSLQIDNSHLAQNPDLTYRNWAFYAHSFVLVRSGNLTASANTLFGWRASDSESAFVVTMLIAGALGALALVRYIIRRDSWLAVLGGALFAGPFFYQLYIDGSEGALGGLALMCPAIYMAGRAIAEPRVSNLVLVGLFVAALQTLHPVFAPLVALWAASYAAVLLGAWLWRERRISVQSLGRAVLALAAVGVLMVGLSPVATVFNIRFYDWVRSNFYTQGLPVYDLPLRVMPSWVFQTREFYFLPVHVSSLQDVVTAYIAPLGLLALAVLALFRYRRSWLIWALVPSMVAFGVYGSTRNCSYCVQRNLLSLGPVAAVMTPVGIAALASYRRRVLNWGAAVAAIGVVVLVGHQATVEARRVIDGGYMAPNEFRTVASQLAGKRGPIYLEAIGQGRSAPAAMEMPSLYDITNEATRQRLAISNETNDYGGLTYLVGVRPPQVKTGPEWVPNYRWVITRVPSIATDRRLVFSRGPFALEERRSPLDVAITSGIAVDNADRDPRGLAWVQGPMTFWVSALERTRVWLVLDFEGNTPARLVQPRGSTTLERTPTHLRVCVPVVSPAPNPLRSTVTLAFRQAPEQPAGTAFGMPSPSKAVRLAGMHATATNCARGR